MTRNSWRLWSLQQFVPLQKIVLVANTAIVVAVMADDFWMFTRRKLCHSTIIIIPEGIVVARVYGTVLLHNLCSTDEYGNDTRYEEQNIPECIRVL